MSPHTWCLQGPRKPGSCATFMLNSHWGRAATGKKILASFYVHRVARSCPTLCDPLDCGLPGFSVRERGSPGKNTGVYWPILVAIPYESTVFPASLAANCPDDLVPPEPLQPKQLHHLHTWPSQGQTHVLHSRAASGANPSGQPTCRAGNKTIIETQGQCG